MFTCFFFRFLSNNDHFMGLDLGQTLTVEITYAVVLIRALVLEVDLFQVWEGTIKGGFLLIAVDNVEGTVALPYVAVMVFLIFSTSKTGDQEP